MQQKHVACCRYKKSCNWHDRLRGHWQNSRFINILAIEVGVTRLWEPRVGFWKLYANAHERGKRVVSNGLNSLSSWAFKVPSHTFFFLRSCFLKIMFSNFVYGFSDRIRYPFCSGRGYLQHFWWSGESNIQSPVPKLLLPVSSPPCFYFFKVLFLIFLFLGVAFWLHRYLQPSLWV